MELWHSKGALFNTDPRFKRVKSFIKDETYGQYKYPRAINSRHDMFKIRVGPIFKQIEKVVFKDPYFIKYVPADERAKVIKEEVHQDNATVIGTDYTSWEALCTRDLMMATEIPLYEYMTQNLPDKEWIRIVKSALTGLNICEFKFFKVIIEATRMSGEMCTSLGNGFMNLICSLFVLHKLKCDRVKGKVEGDDGVFSFLGKAPTPDDYQRLGLLIKIAIYKNVTSGSFCGVIADFDDLINITNPIESMLDFGYTNRAYINAGDKKLKMLLRAKAMSMAYQYPGCPILYELAQYGLRVTEGSRWQLPWNMSQYEIERFKRMHDKFQGKIPRREPTYKTRLLMEETYGIKICHQMEIEEYLRNKNDLTPIRCPAVIQYCNKDQIDYYNKYASHTRDYYPWFGQNYSRSTYRGSLHLYV
jgi:hypothetical protein